MAAAAILERSAHRSFLEHYRRSFFDQAGELAGVPVCQPHAPVGLGIADPPRFRRAVYPVVRLVDLNPDNTHWIVGARCDLLFCIGGIGIPKQVGVVVVRWIALHQRDHPIPQGERVVFAAARHWGMEDDLVFLIKHCKD